MTSNESREVEKDSKCPCGVQLPWHLLTLGELKHHCSCGRVYQSDGSGKTVELTAENKIDWRQVEMLVVKAIALELNAKESAYCLRAASADRERYVMLVNRLQGEEADG